MLSTDLASVEAATFKLILLANSPIDSFDSSPLPLTQGQWRACLFAIKHGGSFSVVASTDAGSVESLKRESRRHTFSNYPCFPEEISFTALPQGAKDLFSTIIITITFVASIDNLPSLSGLDLSTGH